MIRLLLLMSVMLMSVGSSAHARGRYSCAAYDLYTGQPILCGYYEAPKPPPKPTKAELEQWEPYPPNCEARKETDECMRRLCVENPRAYVLIGRSMLSYGGLSQYCRYCGSHPACKPGYKPRQPGWADWDQFVKESRRW